MSRRQIAWIVILVVDVAYFIWGAMAAASPAGLLGPGGKAILPAGYEGYSGASWSELLRTSPMTANYMIVLFRTYGIHCAVFGLMGSAIAVTALRPRRHFDGRRESQSGRRIEHPLADVVDPGCNSEFSSG